MICKNCKNKMIFKNLISDFKLKFSCIVPIIVLWVKLLNNIKTSLFLLMFKIINKIKIKNRLYCKIYFNI
jgi:hypothetical protein